MLSHSVCWQFCLGIAGGSPLISFLCVHSHHPWKVGGAISGNVNQEGRGTTALCLCSEAWHLLLSPRLLPRMCQIPETQNYE